MEWYQLLAVFTAIVTSLITVIGFLLWFIVQNNTENIKFLDTRLSAHQLDIANNYAKIVDVKSSYADVLSKLDAMQDSIGKLVVSVTTLVAKTGTN